MTSQLYDYKHTVGKTGNYKNWDTKLKHTKYNNKYLKIILRYLKTI